VSDWRTFEDFARERMGRYFGVALTARPLAGFPKLFDCVSADGATVGDAKCLAMVRRLTTPPAKLAEISAHVWLLEHVPATRRFLVFGNQVEVPRRWLKRYGAIPTPVAFYFLGPDGQVINLRAS
jgi:hypothetical protein